MDTTAQWDTAPCHLCTGKCCSYFALEIDKPATVDDYEGLKWYILHENTSIFIEDGDWYLQIQNKCKFLLPNHRCGIYDSRPQICRDYGLDEKGEVFCDFTTRDVAHDAEYTTPEAIDDLIRKRFPKAKKYHKPVSYRLPD